MAEQRWCIYDLRIQARFGRTAGGKEEGICSRDIPVAHEDDEGEKSAGQDVGICSGGLEGWRSGREVRT